MCDARTGEAALANALSADCRISVSAIHGMNVEFGMRAIGFEAKVSWYPVYEPLGGFSFTSKQIANVQTPLAIDGRRYNRMFRILLKLIIDGVRKMLQSLLIYDSPGGTTANVSRLYQSYL